MPTTTTTAVEATTEGDPVRPLGEAGPDGTAPAEAIGASGTTDTTGARTASAAAVSDVEPDAAVLHAAVQGELAVDAHELGPAELGERCLRLRAELDRLEVAVAMADVAFEESRAHVKLDLTCTTASKWLAKHRDISISSARAAYRHARRLRHLPLVVSAVVAGIVSGWHARKLTAAAGEPGRMQKMIEDQAFFLGQRQLLDGHGFEDAVEHWTEVNFGDEIAARALAAEEGRYGHCSQTFDDVWKVDALLEPHWGELFANVLDEFVARLRERDWSLAREEHGDDATSRHLGRTAAQRRADALVVMAMAADSALPNASARSPLLSVLVDWKTLYGRVCETERGVHLAPDQALDVLRVADVERAVWGSDDRIAVSERARVFRGAERRAVELRDRFCTAPGCEVPARDCDVDHVDRYAEGGPTCQRNARLRCPHDHEGRMRPPEARDLAWEYVPDQWEEVSAPSLFDLDAEMNSWREHLAGPDDLLT